MNSRGRHSDFRRDVYLDDLDGIAAGLAHSFEAESLEPQRINSPVMVGRVWKHPIHDGIFACGHDVDYLADVRMAETPEPALSCAILLDGEASMRLGDHGDISLRKNVCTFVTLGEGCVCEGVGRGGVHSAVAGFLILKTFFDGAADDIDEIEVGHLHRRFLDSSPVLELPESPLLADLARQCVDHGYGGTLAKLYIESRTLALIVESAKLLAHDTPYPARAVTERRRERVASAKAELDRSLANPPTTLQLARLTGTNATTLKVDFQEVYGMSIFAYVRRQRLEFARALLAARKMSVAEAAYTVGFTDPNNFSTAYRQYFGYPPSREPSLS